LAFNETLTFPQRRVEIYEEALDALLKKWDTSRGIKRDEVYRKLSLGHKKNLLERIAAETFEKNEYFIPQAELERRITDYVKNVPPHETNEATDGEIILKAIEAQHGIFVERANEVYSFSHLTFQEYFTAKYIVANATKGTLTNLVREHCTDGRWREVFLLTASLLPDASQFMKTFRRGVDELLGGDEKLRELLTWGYKRSILVQDDPWLVQASFLYMEISYTDINYALTLDHKWANLAFNNELDLDDALTLTLAITLDHKRAQTYARAYDYARHLGLNELAKELAALPLPNNEATNTAWQEFTDKLRALMIKHRDIGHEWNLTKGQEKRLTNYLAAAHLLNDCLKLAFMPPDEKKAMLNSLYLPPAQVEDGQNAWGGR
jgi:hypothetical protein